jgi:hypothetical protein
MEYLCCTGNADGNSAWQVYHALGVAPAFCVKSAVLDAPINDRLAIHQLAARVPASVKRAEHRPRPCGNHEKQSKTRGPPRSASKSPSQLPKRIVTQTSTSIHYAYLTNIKQKQLLSSEIKAKRQPNALLRV